MKGDLDGIVENSYKPMPEGIYQGRVTKLEVKTSQAGNAYINIEFSLANNRKAWDKLMFHTPGCLNVTKGKMENLGFTREERKELDPDNIQSVLEAVRYIITGKTYDVKIKIKEGENVISYYTDPNASEESDPIDPTTEAPATGKKPRIQSPWG